MRESITPIGATLPSAILNVIGELQHNPNAVRIQKLLFYLCRDQWESDCTRLDALSWYSLIEEVRQAYPTFAQLRSRLTYQIGTLNKSAEYALIGQIILSILERAYAQDATTIITASKRSTTLDQDVNISRIKKLLIYTCRRYWEANSCVIDQVSTAELLNELMQRYPTLEDLRPGLSTIVKTLNKPAEYSLVAEIILREVEPFYGEEDSGSEPAQAERIDLFDVRREILKYTNPLKAKILLFSAVYYVFEFCPQDWSNLKLYSLDGLLRTSLTQVETIDEFQQLLIHKASQLKEPETYLEIVPVLTRSLKSSYYTLRQTLLVSLRASSVADATLASSTQPSL
ncbi:hypothetical protein [Leptolyngbya sp. FACHB-17]|uniref:hypothetical protein n=1 Tax=unclassified Leptolyngbya TaxID=2650499 RepID=UPI0016816DB9|nr:hypothetical protein [Leptolyngbya sp. FACHB-17]MBD2081686.1 hypothetical protein [Leptolyngbya sp. FACHB-17]